MRLLKLFELFKLDSFMLLPLNYFLMLWCTYSIISLRTVFLTKQSHYYLVFVRIIVERWISYIPCSYTKLIFLHLLPLVSLQVDS